MTADLEVRAAADADEVVPVEQDPLEQGYAGADLLSDATQIYFNDIGHSELLSGRQRCVIERRYGLNGCEIQTLEQLANELSLTRERVRQIQLEALGSLRRMLRRDGLSKDVLL